MTKSDERSSRSLRFRPVTIKDLVRSWFNKVYSGYWLSKNTLNLKPGDSLRIHCSFQHHKNKSSFLTSWFERARIQNSKSELLSKTVDFQSIFHQSYLFPSALDVTTSIHRCIFHRFGICECITNGDSPTIICKMNIIRYSRIIYNSVGYNHQSHWIRKTRNQMRISR